MVDNDTKPLDESPTIPVLTIVSTLVTLLAFGILCLIFIRWQESAIDKPNRSTAEEALKQMRQEQRKHLEEFGYDQTNKSSFMPIDTAIERLSKQKTEPGKVRP